MRLRPNGRNCGCITADPEVILKKMRFCPNRRRYTRDMSSLLKRGPSAALAMRRAIILKCTLVKGLAAPPVEYLRSVMSQWTPEERSRFAAEAAQMSMQNVNHLKAAGLWLDVEEDERRLLQAGIDQISPQQRIDASWLAESIACLLWALKIIPEVPSYDQEASHELVNALPANSIKDIIKQAHLRPQEEIKRQRNIAELWHWRARTRQLQEEGHLFQLPGGYTIEQVIELAALKGAENADLPHPIGSDFPAMGKPYRDLSFEEFAILTSIAQERHKALNWLCGFSSSGRWADTPTHT
jgi:hypothetical protein